MPRASPDVCRMVLASISSVASVWPWITALIPPPRRVDRHVAGRAARVVVRVRRDGEREDVVGQHGVGWIARVGVGDLRRDDGDRADHPFGQGGGRCQDERRGRRCAQRERLTRAAADDAERAGRGVDALGEVHRDGRRRRRVHGEAEDVVGGHPVRRIDAVLVGHLRGHDGDRAHVGGDEVHVRVDGEDGRPAGDRGGVDTADRAADREPAPATSTGSLKVTLTFAVVPTWVAPLAGVVVVTDGCGSIVNDTTWLAAIVPGGSVAS